MTRSNRLQSLPKLRDPTGSNNVDSNENIQSSNRNFEVKHVTKIADSKHVERFFKFGSRTAAAVNVAIDFMQNVPVHYQPYHPKSQIVSLEYVLKTFLVQHYHQIQP